MKEPWIRVVKKAELGKRETLILRLEAIVLALVAGGFFILLIGQNHDSTFNCVAGRDAGI